MKREPGTSPDWEGKTGTVPRQHVTPAGAPRRARLRRQGIGQAAVMIGVITVLARLVGFGRQVVFAHTVGTTCLGTAYTTANMVPNIIYDIVLGGALSSVVVPVLAGPARDAAHGAGGLAAESAAEPSAPRLAATPGAASRAGPASTGTTTEESAPPSTMS